MSKVFNQIDMDMKWLKAKRFDVVSRALDILMKDLDVYVKVYLGDDNRLKLELRERENDV